MARVSIHWALLQADLQTDPERSRRLRQSARKRCRSVAAKLQNSLTALSLSKESAGLCLSLLQAEQGKVHLGAVLQLLRTGDKGKATILWEEIEAGLEAVTPKGALTPELGPIRAALLGAKAVACCLALAMKKQCTPEELFSSVWGWNPPKIKSQLKLKTESKHRSKSPVTDTTPLETGAKRHPDVKSASAEHESRKTKESSVVSKKPKELVPKITVSKSSMVFKTPKATRTSRPKSVSTSTGIGDLKAFDFTNEVPEISVNFTPSLHPSGTQRGIAKSKIAPKGSFEVYKDSSPAEEKHVIVPAAPKRTKRSRFKVWFIGFTLHEMIVEDIFIS